MCVTADTLHWSQLPTKSNKTVQNPFRSTWLRINTHCKNQDASGHGPTNAHRGGLSTNRPRKDFLSLGVTKPTTSQNCQNHSSNTLRVLLPTSGSLRCHPLTIPCPWVLTWHDGSEAPFPSSPVDTGGEKGTTEASIWRPSWVCLLHGLASLSTT